MPKKRLNKEERFQEKSKLLLEFFESRKPHVLHKIKEVRETNTIHTPKMVIDKLQLDLRAVEAKFGCASPEFATEANIYILSCIIIHDIDPTSGKANRKLIAKWKRIDGKITRSILRAFGVTLDLLDVLASVVAKAGKEEHVGIATRTKDAQEVLKEKLRAKDISRMVIAEALRVLGPAPSNWPKTLSKRSLIHRLLTWVRH